MIHLLVPFYVDSRKERREEIEESVRKNLGNHRFASMTLFCEGRDLQAALTLVPNALGKVITLPRRARYVDLLNAPIQVASGENAPVVVMANADVYFDETIELAENVCKGQVLCLTRDEQRPFSEGLYWPELETGLSHDAWIFRPPLKVAGEYEFGAPGCELRFAGDCEKAGYAVLNPCRQIHVIHNHGSGMRTYVATTPNVPGPYAHVYVTPEWPLKPPKAQEPPPAPPPFDAVESGFIRGCVEAQLSGLWTNSRVESIMESADKRVSAMFELAEKVAREAKNRGLLP